MVKVLTAEYDAKENALRLDEPLEGIADHQKVAIHVAEVERPWLALEGTLSKEAGEELSRAINEMFPPWEE